MWSKHRFLKVIFGVAAVGLIPSGSACAQMAGGWSSSQVIQPSALVARMKSKGHRPPIILQVGFDTLYRSKHIPGAIFVGPASQQDGLDRLQAAVARLPKAREIYIYCGCCPIGKCPNVRPAYDLLTQMGFTHVKVLMLPTNFSRDWVAKGYPSTGE